LFCGAKPSTLRAMRTAIAWTMTICRVLFAPLVIWLASRGRAGWLISGCIVAEIVLDIFDGIVARKLGVATDVLRRMDSLIDTLFYLAVLYTAWTWHAQTLRERKWLILALLSMEAVRYVFDYFKFHREAAYHMWSSKAWGLVLGAAVVALLGFNHAGWLLSAALIVGILCDCEGLAISFLLRESVQDVPHIFRALELRREQLIRQQGRAIATAAR
jgi:phosphatidylglycerophosphate synthase